MTKTKNILDEIMARKRSEVEIAKELYPRKLLEQSVYYTTPVVSLKQYLNREDRAGVIAEIKRRSPSKGVINESISIEQVSIGYMQGGASALSILTDEVGFGGSNNDLTTARSHNFCPILRKDFICDEYQLFEARSIGADAVLLIARALSGSEIASLSKIAHELGLEVLCELHSESDIEKLPADGVDVLGVNNRSLEDFSVSLDHSFRMIEKLPKEQVVISESGIHDASQMLDLRRAGFSGYLIGEYFMRHNHPQLACAKLIEEYWALEGQALEQGAP